VLSVLTGWLPAYLRLEFRTSVSGGSQYKKTNIRMNATTRVLDHLCLYDS